MEIYGDIFFIYNLIMDYTVLKITAILWNTAVSKGQKMFLWCVVTNLLYIFSIYFAGIYFFLPYAILALAVYLSFKPKSLLKFTGYLLTAYVVTFFLGSISLGLMAVFGADSSCILILAVIFLIIIRRISQNIALEKMAGRYMPIEIITNEHSDILTAYVDSGHSLEYNNTPVLIADSRYISDTAVNEFFYIKCNTVSGTDFLKAFNAKLSFGNTVIEQGIVAISNAPLSGDFNALISPDFFKEEIKC